MRAGAGIFYVQDIGNTVWDMAANLAAHTQDVANTVTHDLTFEHPFAAGAACGTTAPFVCISTPQGLANQYNRKTAYEEMWELNIQRQLSNLAQIRRFSGHRSAEINRLQSHDSQIFALVGNSAKKDGNNNYERQSIHWISFQFCEPAWAMVEAHIVA